MTLHSMTAYGYGEYSHGEMAVSCEVRTLNSRFLEVNVRLPRSLLALEVEVINHVKSILPRGKVDVFLDCQRRGATKDLPHLDPAAVQHYLGLYKQLAATARSSGLADLAPLAFRDLVRLDGLLTETKAGKDRDIVETQRPCVFSALSSALTLVVASRKKEGEALGLAMADLLVDLERDRAATAALRDSVLQQLQANLRRRIDQALAALAKTGQLLSDGPSQERLAIEVTLASDKADIDEELTRLATHLQEFRHQMTTATSAGRKLDFLCQEMHREVTTMANKLVQSEVAPHTLAMKQTIERLRQQVQNIE